MRNKAERIYYTERKKLQRKRLMQALGQQGGIYYDKHIEKINKSLGYMKDGGNVSHYVCCGFGVRTKNSSRRGTPSSLIDGPRHIYKPHDLRQIERAKEYEGENSGTRGKYKNI